MAQIIIRTPISLTDPRYFCNKSWTLSYNMSTKSWISFHSYIPNWYIAENNFFYSGLNSCCNDFEFEFIAGIPIPDPITTTTSSTTSTSTTARPLDCTIDGNVIELSTSSTTSTSTSSTSSSTTTNIPYLCETLGDAERFVVLGGSTITNTGTSVINGDLGLYPGTSVTGFPPGIVNGTQHITDSLAAAAKISAKATYDCLFALTSPTRLGAAIGGMTIAPGTYDFASSVNITGTVILDGESDPNAVFVFIIPSTLITATSSIVSLINNAVAGNIYWIVGSSATIGVSTTMVGTIIADQSITMNTSATLDGKAFALVAAVTLDTNVINRHSCSVNPCTTSTSTTSSTSTSTSTSSTSTSTSSTSTSSSTSSSTSTDITSTSTSTNTTQLPCDSPTSYNGGEAYPSTLNVSLSSSLGYVTLDFDAYSIPDQYIVIFDGNIVINTGYRGDSNYDFGNIYRTAFTSTLLGRVDPVGTTYPNNTLYPDDGYPRILGSGLGSTYFYKSTGTTSATVNVYAPMNNTVWVYILGCPVPDEPTTTTSSTTSTSSTTTDTTSTSSTSTTSTTTTEPTTSTTSTTSSTSTSTSSTSTSTSSTSSTTSTSSSTTSTTDTTSTTTSSTSTTTSSTTSTSTSTTSTTSTTTTLLFSLTGGDTQVDAGGYRTITFLQSGTLTVVGSGDVEYLVVAGGGGGGSDSGGGGGAGGLLTGVLTVTSGSKTITVGDGGISNTVGTNSVFESVTAPGGGKGGLGYNVVPTGGNGGCGGGGGSNTAGGITYGGTGSIGYAGGHGDNGTYLVGGGGGGMGSVGGDQVDFITSGSGGTGISSGLSGTTVYYTSGGSGGAQSGGSIGSVSDGGGALGSSTTNGNTGMANTGGGGGGGAYSGYSGGSGGSGIVIIRYLL